MIELIRGNKLLLDLTIDNGDENYTFKDGDIVTFKIFKQYGLDKKPILSKNFIPEIGSEVCKIELSQEETKIGEIQNIPIEYWYEISLNSEVVIGYDKDGAKKLILYPEGEE